MLFRSEWVLNEYKKLPGSRSSADKEFRGEGRFKETTLLNLYTNEFPPDVLKHWELYWWYHGIRNREKERWQMAMGGLSDSERQQAKSMLENIRRKANKSIQETKSQEERYELVQQEYLLPDTLEVSGTFANEAIRSEEHNV